MKKLIISLFCAVILLVGCNKKDVNKDTKSETSTETKKETTAEKTDNAEVEIKDAHGTVKVKKNPKKVVALDNRTFDTLSAWGIKPVAVPKDVMPPKSVFVKDDSIKNIGNHREPNLELIAAENPDLVIVGQRFVKHYKAIKELVPNATVIDLNIDVSEKAEKSGENLVNGLKNSTEALGKIFGKEKEAKELNDKFDKAIENAKKNYKGEKVMSILVTGGKIRFSAPHSGRVWGPMYEIFGWKPALEINKSSSNHKGDDISVEAIAQSNPDWLFVLDRDAATSKGNEGNSAKEVLEKSEALKNIKAIKENKIIYAPNDTYTNESIQTYLKLFDDIAKAFK